MPNIPADIKTEWTKRLCDGRPQIKADLHTDKGQCCLGVLCEVMVEKTGLQVEARVYNEGSEVEFTSFSYGVGSDRDSTVLPDKVMNDLGFQESEGDIPGEPIEMIRPNGMTGSSNTLAQLNDWGMSFEQIADLIDERL